LEGHIQQRTFRGPLNIAAAGLREAIAQNACYDPESQRFIKAVYPDGSRDLTVDSSASAVFLYGGFDASDRSVVETMNSIRDKLWIRTRVGGLARYENDEYQRASQRGDRQPMVHLHPLAGEVAHSAG